MDDILDILKTDRDTLTDFEKILHGEKNDIDDETNDEIKEEEIESRFSYNFKKRSWSICVLETVPSTEASDQDNITNTYTINTKFDYLLYLYFTVKLPALKILKKYKNTVRICYTHNLGHNIFNNAELRYNNSPKEKLNKIWMDIYSQFFMKPGFRDHYNIMIGNVPMLEDWNNNLPGYNLIIPQPWSFSRITYTAIPLFNCSKSRVTFTYNMKTKYSDLIRMQCRSPPSEKNPEYGPWENIKFNWRYLDGMQKNGRIPFVQMWGQYNQISGAEREWRKGFKQEIYTRDILCIDSDNNDIFGHKVVVPIKCDFPILSMFWVGENINSTEYNNLSNYTTNTENFLEGWNPIKSWELKYGEMKRISERDSEHSEKADPWFKSLSPPNEPGYNQYALGYNLQSIDGDIGLSLGEGKYAKMIFNLDDTNPFLIESIDNKKKKNKTNIPEEIINDKKEKTPSPNFKIHIILLILKKITYKYEGPLESIEYFNK